MFVKCDGLIRSDGLSTTYPRRGRALLVLVAWIALWPVGCSSVAYTERDYQNWDPAKKAREITRRRNLARDALQNYRATGEFRYLEEVVQHEKETIEIASATCPTCYHEYGLALSMAGRHFYYKQADALRGAEEAASAREANELRVEARDYREQMRDYLQKSYRAFISFFTHPDNVYQNPNDLLRVMHDQEILENYDEAIYFLRRYRESLGENLTEVDKEEIAKLLRRYRRLAERKREIEQNPDRHEPEADLDFRDRRYLEDEGAELEGGRRSPRDSRDR